MTMSRSCRGTVVLAIAFARITAFSVWPPVRVAAGVVNDPADCGCRSDNAGGGYCWGTLQCFRDKPDPDAYASMDAIYTSWGTRILFNAYVDKRKFSCEVNNPGLVPLALSTITALGPHNSFWVWWDRSGICHQVYVGHSSADL